MKNGLKCRLARTLVSFFCGKKLNRISINNNLLLSRMKRVRSFAPRSFKVNTTVQRTRKFNTPLHKVGPSITLKSHKFCSNATDPRLHLYKIREMSLTFKPRTSSKPTTGHDLIECVKSGSISTIKKMLKQGHSPDVTSLSGNPCLVYAIFRGNLNIVKLLVEAGANVNRECDAPLERTPLHYGCLRGERKIVELLVERGAKLNVSDQCGNTPAHYAAGNDEFYSSKSSILELLLLHGAIIDLKNHEGETPLDLAKRDKKLESIKTLLKYKSLKQRIYNFDIKNRSHLSDGLVYAIQTGDLKLFKLLVKHGANVHHTIEKYGMPPLVYAATWRRKNIIKYLIKLGVSLNACNENGYTALHVLCWFNGTTTDEPCDNNIKIIELLLKSGADYSIKSKYGDQTPLEMALFYGHLKSANAILQHIKSVEKE